MKEFEGRVYYPKWRIPALIIGVFQIVLVGWLLFHMLQDPSSGLSIWSVVVSGFVAFFCLSYAFGTKVQIFSEGMNYSQVGFRAYTTWSNVEKLDSVRAGPMSLPVLRLRQPAVISWAWMPAAKRDELVQLPLNMFDVHPAGPLMQGLRHYAPQLFDS
jgi:hypothetical protein